MNVLTRNSVLALSLGLLLTSGARAQDIDLFLNEGQGAGVPPNVLFMLDNSANWNATLYKVGGKSITKKNVIHQALYQFVQTDSLKEDVRTGIMNFTSGSGGKVISAVELLTSTYQAQLANMIYGAKVWSANTSYAVGDLVVPSTPNSYYYKVTSAGASGATEPSWPTANNSTVTNGTVVFKIVGALDNQVEKLVAYNNAPYGTSMHEAYLYFKGLAPKFGKTDTDYDPDAFSGSYYKSPALENHCAKNFVIFIGNGSPDSGENNTAESLLTALNGKLSSDPIALSPDNYQSNWADEYARFMAGTDVDPSFEGQQNIVTYVIDVVDPSTATTTPDKAARSFLKSIAERGQGRYFTAASVSDLVAALQEIMDEVIAVNSVFASTTLPVSVNVRGTTLNQVYMGVFRPDDDMRPRWMGNLKMYKLGYDSGSNSIFLADRTGARADSPVTGFVTSTATSYWTHDSTYWSYSPRGTPLSASDAPDGEVVEKGAVAQWLRENTGTRNIYTCVGGCNGALSSTPFTVANGSITSAMLGAGSSAERDAIIKWIRGEDVLDENGNSSTADVRASVHGDVLHSRPAVVNYARVTGSEDDVIAFYGANDGIFRAVKGGKATTLSTDPGTELWGFIPEEFLGQLKSLYTNASMSGAADKPFFVDGTVGAYQGGGKVYIYLTMRRGGRFIYALDVTDPATPKMLWKITGGSGDFAELGQTWSDPSVVKINGYANPVLVFGAGYDTAEDSESVNTMGRGVYFVDAFDGSLVKFFGTPTITDSVPATVTAVDTNSDGTVDRAYAADTGGNIWRLDISSSTMSDWTMSLMAKLGGTGVDNRKFLYPPDVVFGMTSKGYDSVLIGSGDREKPAEKSVANRFYMLKDTGASTDWPITDADLVEARGTTEVTLTAQDMGWKYTYDTGEKTVGGAVTLGGITYFNTHTPAGASVNTQTCAPSLGIARAYAINYLTAGGNQLGDRYAEKPGGGFLPSPVPFVVEIDGKIRVGVISGTQAGGGEQPPINKRTRAYWYKQNVD